MVIPTAKSTVGPTASTTDITDMKEKTKDHYDGDHYTDARESLLDAVAICVTNEYTAAEKILCYLRFC